MLIETVLLVAGVATKNGNIYKQETIQTCCDQLNNPNNPVARDVVLAHIKDNKLLIVKEIQSG